MGELTKRIREQQADTTSDDEPSFTVTWTPGYEPTPEDDDAIRQIVLAAWEKMKDAESDGEERCPDLSGDIEIALAAAADYDERASRMQRENKPMRYEMYASAAAAIRSVCSAVKS